MVWNRNKKPFPRQLCAGSGRIFQSTCMGPHLSVPKKSSWKWHSWQPHLWFMEATEKPAALQMGQAKAGHPLGCLPSSYVCGGSRWSYSRRYLGGRKLQRPRGSSCPAEGKNNGEKGSIGLELFICLFISLHTICCGLWVIRHFRKVADEDLWSWALRVPPKYFFTFLVKTQNGEESGSWQNLKYLNSFSKAQECWSLSHYLS